MDKEKIALALLEALREQDDDVHVFADDDVGLPLNLASVIVDGRVDLLKVAERILAEVRA